MNYIITEEFLRIEAIGHRGARHGDPADPVRLRIRIVDSTDSSIVIEESTDLYRLHTGVWAYKLDESLYEAGKQYTANFLYEMIPGNLNASRKNFVWAPVPEQPRVASNCVVHGTLLDITGAPVPDGQLVVETYRNFVTLNHRTAQSNIRSDAFGNWYVELPRRSIARFVLGDLSKVVQVPTQNRASLSSLQDYQPDDVARDAFGYPLP